MLFYVFFFFKQKTAYEMRISDWSSDVCSSDLRTKRVSKMSVRMALAKLCACACGGAIIGGGAVHIAESPRPAHLTKIKSIKHAPKEQAAERIRRTVTTTAFAPGPVTIAPQAEIGTASGRERAWRDV